MVSRILAICVLLVPLATRTQGNRFKSDRTHGKLANGNLVRLFHPQQDHWSEHFDWSIDGTVIVGLTDIGAATVDLLTMNRPQVVDVRSLWDDAGRPIHRVDLNRRHPARVLGRGTFSKSWNFGSLC